MTEETKRRGRPAKAIIGAEASHEDWKNPPLQDNESSIENEILKEPGAENLSIEDSETVLAGYFSIESAPKDRRIVVSETGKDQTCVYWRVRRVVDKKNLRYLTTGKWTDDLSRLDIDFEPKYWRPYVASDYIPIPRAK